MAANMSLVSLDFKGAYPDQLFVPGIAAQSQATQKVVSLLLDTGMHGGCYFKKEKDVVEFAGSDTNQQIGVTCAPITAVPPPFLPLEYGMPFPKLQDQFSRAVPLYVEKKHVNGISAAYLLGPLQSTNDTLSYPQRLIAWWPMHEPSGQPVKVYPTQKDQDDDESCIFMKHVSFYTTAVNFVPPGETNIPQASNVVEIPVTLVKNVPIALVTAQFRKDPVHDVQCTFDTGATYNVLSEQGAKTLGMNFNQGDISMITITLNSTPQLILEKVPVLSTERQTGDCITLGTPLFSYFSTVILDFGVTVKKDKDQLYPKGFIKLL